MSFLRTLLTNGPRALGAVLSGIAGHVGIPSTTIVVGTVATGTVASTVTALSQVALKLNSQTTTPSQDFLNGFAYPATKVLEAGTWAGSKLLGKVTGTAAQMAIGGATEATNSAITATADGTESVISHLWSTACGPKSGRPDRLEVLWNEYSPQFYTWSNEAWTFAKDASQEISTQTRFMGNTALKIATSEGVKQAVGAVLGASAVIVVSAVTLYTVYKTSEMIKKTGVIQNSCAFIGNSMASTANKIAEATKYGFTQTQAVIKPVYAQCTRDNLSKLGSDISSKLKKHLETAPAFVPVTKEQKPAATTTTKQSVVLTPAATSTAATSVAKTATPSTISTPQTTASPAPLKVATNGVTSPAQTVNLPGPATNATTKPVVADATLKPAHDALKSSMASQKPVDPTDSKNAKTESKAPSNMNAMRQKGHPNSGIKIVT